MKIDNKIYLAMSEITSKEDVEGLSRDIYLMPRDERAEHIDEIRKQIDTLISDNNRGLRTLNAGVRTSELNNSIYEMFEDYVEDVNADLMKIYDRL